ncbi:MAG TPA: S-ribosylhomocysteine lyase [Epulopiscium sp.]|nr:S-ribosylhomocysteine lyase [Candidatus Epulonipiscium sp.]
MDKITSFTINHLKLLPGVYVSRIDYVKGEPITTYDIRMKTPNHEPVLHTAEMHAIEHLAATFLRNHCIYGDDIIYFGPMGCRTGFYLLVKGDLSSAEIAPLVTETFEFIKEFKDIIPGASARDCGNHLDMNLPMARYESNKFLQEILYKLKDDNLNYPK